MTPSITQDDVNNALGNFLTAILGLAATQIIVGQVNRVASPEGDYCVMWPLRRPRLATNVDSYQDVKYLGFIEATTMIVTQVFTGEIAPGQTIFGIDVLPGTTVVDYGSGQGGAGSYEIQPNQTAAGPLLSSGSKIIAQATEVVMQVDVHGPASGDNIQTISTAFRDAYGVFLFEGTGITPLYAEDPRQLPFTTAAVQYEDRWSIDLHMDCSPTISVPIEFADSIDLTLATITGTQVILTDTGTIPPPQT